MLKCHCCPFAGKATKGVPWKAAKGLHFSCVAKRGNRYPQPAPM
jgi:hypothetical protein